MVRTDAGSDTDLEVLRLGDELAREVARVEGCGDEDLGVLDVLLEDAVRALLVAADLQRSVKSPQRHVGVGKTYDELVALVLEPLLNAELMARE